MSIEQGTRTILNGGRPAHRPRRRPRHGAIALQHRILPAVQLPAPQARREGRVRAGGVRNADL